MADIEATKSIKDALRTVNVKVLDHIIVAGPNKSYSFGENDRL
jgi:DNA repair protein RadC